jgi:hypothetical protein
MNQKVPGKQVVEVVYPENLGGIYVNHAQFLMTASDLSIDIGILQQNPKGGKPTAHISHRLIMSPQHAKMFLTKMQEIINGYERDFAEISITPKKK